MFDGGFSNEEIGLHKEVITYKTVLDIFKKYSIEDDIGILSEDTDYADYWIVETILTQYKPKVVIHEVNQQGPEKCVTVPKTDKLIFWDSTEFHGASVCAFYCLAKNSKSYTMIYCESKGVNCFWVRNDLLEKHLKINSEFVQSILTPEFLFRKPNFAYTKTTKSWQNITC